MRAVLLSALGAIAFTLNARAAAQTPHQVMTITEAGRRVDARLLALVDSGFSGAVIVERNDSLLLAAGYGYANRERRIPFTVGTIAQVGSITKQFTATAIVDLVRRGRLRATDSLVSIFPNVAAQARGITIEQLLTHSAGLGDDCVDDDFARVTRDDLLKRCLAKPLVAPPGARAQYSNMSFSVLAAVVEEKSGESIEQYLRKHFFDPLHLTKIGYTFRDIPSDSFAVGYKGNVPQRNIADAFAPLGADYWNLKGNGGIQASTLEMYRWYQALKSGPVITEEMRKELFTARRERDPGIFFGYGWFVRQDSTGRTTQVSHSGSDGTFFSAWLWRPLDRLFVYSVTNFGENDMAKLVVSNVVQALRRPN